MRKKMLAAALVSVLLVGMLVFGFAGSARAAQPPCELIAAQIRIQLTEAGLDEETIELIIEHFSNSGLCR